MFYMGVAEKQTTQCLDNDNFGLRFLGHEIENVPFGHTKYIYNTRNGEGWLSTLDDEEEYSGMLLPQDIVLREHRCNERGITFVYASFPMEFIEDLVADADVTVEIDILDVVVFRQTFLGLFWNDRMVAVEHSFEFLPVCRTAKMERFCSWMKIPLCFTCNYGMVLLRCVLMIGIVGLVVEAAHRSENRQRQLILRPSLVQHERRSKLQKIATCRWSVLAWNVHDILFQTKKCCICNNAFQANHSGTPPSQRVGSDGKPLVILKCCHVCDQVRFAIA